MVTRSDRLDHVHSDIRGPLYQEALRMESEGINVLKLNTGNPGRFGFKLPNSVRQALALHIDEAVPYCDVRGMAAARNVICTYHIGRGLQGIMPNDVFICNGVSEAASMLLNALIGTGDEILLPSPCYSLWSNNAYLCGGKPVFYRCDPANEWNPDIEDIKSKVTDRTKAILVINPNNPTGAVYGKEVLLAIAEIARQHHLVILADEIYDRLVMDGLRHESIGALAPDLPCVALLGTAAVRQKQIEAWRDGLLITSYDQLRRDVLAYRDKPLTHVLLDEAQNIKNAASQAAKAVKTLNAAHRFALTGTPIENRLSELWSIFDFLMPGYLHAYKRFRERFEAPIVQDADEQARQNLHLMVAPFILRRMKKDVLDDLPDKIETVMTSEMTPGQAKVYHAHAEKLMRDAESELADPQGRMRLLAGLTRLRQLCCDPRLCLEDYAGGSGKLEQLLELVRDMAAQGHRMLIFSQFTSMLALLEDALHEAGFETLKLTGETDKAKRMALVEQFNGGDTPVFLISLKAGGTGLNLVGADVVIHYDPWWNTAAQNQATDRAYRIGQTKGVQVFSLIAAGTIEERIVLLQEEKKALSDGVLLGEDSLFTVDAAALREILKA